MVNSPIKINESEHSSQTNFIQWLDRHVFYTSHSEFSIFKKYVGVAFAIPNAAQRTPETSKYLKEEGMLKGASDVIVIMSRPLRIVCFEFKTLKGVQSEFQKIFQKVCYILDIPYYVVRKSYEATGIIKGMIK